MTWLGKLFRKEQKEAGMKMAGGTPMSKPASGAKTAKDPVCGMTVHVEGAAATSIYEGQTYYFCAMGCKKAFDQNPAKYLTGKGEMRGGTHGH